MSDLLRMDYINSLGGLTITLIGDKEQRYDLFLIDAETGFLTFNASGKPQNAHISDVGSFFDWDGNEYFPDTFYSDWEQTNDKT